jgi:hypothetical protein
MKRHIKGSLLMASLASLALSLIVSAGNSTGADTLAGLKNAYEQEIRKLDDAEKAAKPQLESQYLKALDDLVKKAMSAGDLDATVAGQKEQKRFQEAKSVPNESPAGLPDGIVKLQSKYREALKTQTVEKDRKQKLLTEQYVTRLKSLLKSLTQENRIVEATDVNEEIKKVQSVLADVGSRLPAEKTAETVVQPSKPSTTNTVASKPIATNAIPTNGLVLHFSFDKNEGGTVTDESGNNNNGHVNGATWVQEGKHGGAYQFDGIKDFIAVPNSHSLETREVTVMAWICATDFSGDAGAMIIEKRPHDGCWELLFFDRGRLLLRGGSAVGAYTGRHHVKESEWTHVAATIHGKKGAVYVNGKVIRIGNVPGLLPTQGEVQIGVGRNAHAADDHFNGMIDEVMIFNRALTDAEIKTIYEAQK